jgi:Mg2+ and Co2+ transporter CorA
MSREDIHSADKNPVEYIYPFIRLLLIEVNSQVQELGYVLESQFLEGAAGEANTRILQGIWVRLHDIEVDMSASLDSLTNFASSNQTKTGPVLNDFKALMQHISHVQHDLREYLNRHVSMKSLEESRLAVIESRKSIELADSVKRLTQIALIFVPLNLVTSLFGMNFVEFGTGKLHVWIFVAVACLLCVIVAIAVFVTSSRGKLKSLGT